MKKRLRNNKGLTTVEILVSVAILAFFASVAAVGTSAMFSTGEQMMAASKAAVLGADVMEVITNEIRSGESFIPGADGTLSYGSASYGEDCEMKLGEGETAGQLVIAKSDGRIFKPLGTAAYDEVYIKSLSCKIEGNVVFVTVEITYDGTDTLWENTVGITPLYLKVKGDAA